MTMISRGCVFTIFAALWAGCGGAASPAYSGGEATESDDGESAGGETDWSGAEPAFQFSTEDQDAMASFDSDWDSWVGEFQQAVPASSGADCGLGTDLVERICVLSERICEIADRHPEQPSARERCDRGQSGCADARQELDEHCE